MKKISLYAIILTTLFVISCSEAPILNNIDNPNVVENKTEYLVFDSQSELNDVLQEYIAIENGMSVITKSINRKVAKGFVSIAELEQQCHTKNGAGEYDVEEMTLDEFNIMKSKKMLPDPVLCNVLDTTLRISIAGDFYKITPYGTFVTKNDSIHISELCTVIHNFEQIKHDMNITEEDSIVDISTAVKFINSFRRTITDVELIKEQEESVIAATKSSSSYSSNYNVDSYYWQSKTLVGRVWDWFFGTDATRTNGLPSNRRVSVNVFDVNYGFYASAGVKVKMERKKSFLFISYWVDDTADKIVIGFDGFKGTLKLNAPKIPEVTSSDAVNAFNGYINGQIKNVVYKGYNNVDFLKDFSTTIYNFIPYITNLPFLSATTTQTINNTLQTESRTYLNNVAPQTMYSFLSGFTGKYVSALGKPIENKAPRSLLVMPNAGEVTTFMNGVVDYGRRSEKTIRFDMSFGITLKFLGGSFSYSPYLPSSFEINNLDVFGAAYYGGVWKGVRFYN